MAVSLEHALRTKTKTNKYFFTCENEDNQSLPLFRQGTSRAKLTTMEKPMKEPREGHGERQTGAADLTIDPNFRESFRTRAGAALEGGLANGNTALPPYEAAKALAKAMNAGTPNEYL